MLPGADPPCTHGAQQRPQAEHPILPTSHTRSPAAFKLSSRGRAGAPQAPAAGAATFLRSYVTKVACALAVVGVCYTPGLPILAVHWLYALLLSLSVGAIWDVYCAAAVAFYGLEVGFDLHDDNVCGLGCRCCRCCDNQRGLGCARRSERWRGSGKACVQHIQDIAAVQPPQTQVAHTFDTP